MHNLWGWFHAQVGNPRRLLWYGAYGTSTISEARTSDDTLSETVLLSHAMMMDPTVAPASRTTASPVRESRGSIDHAINLNRRHSNAGVLHMSCSVFTSFTLASPA